MNRPWFQEMLVMITFMAILCSDFIVRIINRGGKLVVFIVLVIVVASPLFHIKNIFNKTLPNNLISTMKSDLITTKAILDISGEDDLVFDVYGKAIFRHHPLEPKFLQYRPERFSRLDNLKKTEVKFLIKDSMYYPRFPEETLRWFDEKFCVVKENPNIFIRKGAY
jgi:hypothetical protein